MTTEYVKFIREIINIQKYNTIFNVSINYKDCLIKHNRYLGYV